jgi:hypothetical protein
MTDQRRARLDVAGAVLTQRAGEREQLVRRHRLVLGAVELLAQYAGIELECHRGARR